MKIDIIGSVASGKTTLARKISQKYNVPHYEKDNVVWDMTPYGDRKRSPEERDLHFQKIISGDDWIVEGSPRKCLKESFSCCDYVVVLNEETSVRLFRVFKRWIKQKIGKEHYNTKPTLKFLRYNIKWVLEFNDMKKDLFKELNSYGEKVNIFRNSDEAWKFISMKY